MKDEEKTKKKKAGEKPGRMRKKKKKQTAKQSRKMSIIIHVLGWSYKNTVNRTGSKQWIRGSFISCSNTLQDDTKRKC